ncbi:SDR family oxidoreductase [Patescibacteria group bacterium]|nr:SDR family oxidoreductase [Patescibacteria group bacterium]
MQLKNKSIVITGGSDGLGFSLAKALVAKGALVNLIARNKDKLDLAIEQLGLNAKGFVADVSNWQEIEKVSKEIGSVDVLINNAGVWIEGSLLNNEISEIDKTIDINLKGTIYATKAFLPKLQKETETHLFNVISTSGMNARDEQAVYCASKFGVSGFTEVLKIDLAKTNLKVTGFYPGGMNTKLFDKAGHPKDNQDWMNTNKVAEIVVFMLERDSSIAMNQVVLNKRMTRASN